MGFLPRESAEDLRIIDENEGGIHESQRDQDGRPPEGFGKKKAKKFKKEEDIKKELHDVEKMTSVEVAKHVKDNAWDEAEASVRELSSKIMNIENEKEE